MTAVLLVAGTAVWTDDNLVCRLLERARASFAPEPVSLLTGDLPGAEAFAVGWAMAAGIPTQCEPHKGARGPAAYVRNHKVIASTPDFVLIFGHNRHLDHLAAKTRAAEIRLTQTDQE